jgi:hypothetical protein
MSSYRPKSPVQIGDQMVTVVKRVSRYLPAYRIEGQKEDENGAASPFLLLKLHFSVFLTIPSQLSIA